MLSRRIEFEDEEEWEFNVQYDLFEICKKQLGKEAALYLARKWWGDAFVDALDEEE